jgi:serine/threonine protein phosphatase PrpC
MTNPEVINYGNLDQAIFAVADGIGGFSRGELASFVVLQSLRDKWIKGSQMNQKKISQSLEASRFILNQYAQDSSSIKNLGTTIAGIWFNQSNGIIFNVGDSRVYRINHGYLEQLSKDQSLVQSLKDSGNLSTDEMYKQTNKNIILESINGSANNKKLHVLYKSINIMKNDEFIICTDGLTDVLDLDEMEGCLEKNINISVRNLFKAAYLRGISDDISIIIIRILNLDN